MCFFPNEVNFCLSVRLSYSDWDLAPPLLWTRTGGEAVAPGRPTAAMDNVNVGSGTQSWESGLVLHRI